LIRFSFYTNIFVSSTDIDPQVHFGTSGENNDDRQPTGDGRPLGSGGRERDSGAGRYDQAPSRDDAPQGSGGGGGSGGGDDAVNETSPNHGPSDTHSSGGGDGGGGGGSPSTVDGQWESPLHRTCVKLAIKPDPVRAYAVAISYTFKVNSSFLQTVLHCLCRNHSSQSIATRTYRLTSMTHSPLIPAGSHRCARLPNRDSTS
jgi:hypothetical protein